MLPELPIGRRPGPGVDHDAEASVAHFDRANILARFSNDGVFDWDMSNGGVYRSPSWARKLGYDPAAIEATEEGFLRLVHPDDRETAQAAARRVSSSLNDVTEYEFRIRDAFGEWRSMLARLVTFSENGRITRVVGVHVDLTEYREAELLRRESESRLDAFFENSSAELAIVDCTGKYLYASDAFCRALGKSRAGVIGRNRDELFSPEEAARIAERDRRGLETGQSTITEVTALRDGREHFYEIHNFPISYAEGRPPDTGIIARDVTEQTLAARAGGQPGTIPRPVRIFSRRSGRNRLDRNPREGAWRVRQRRRGLPCPCCGEPGLR